MSKLSLKGVVVGGVTDILATSILSIPAIVYSMRNIDLAHASQAQIQTAMTAALQANTPLYLVQLVIGMSCSVLGGYVGAKLSRHNELLNGSLTSFLCVASGLYALAAGQGSGSLFLHLLGFVGSPALGLLGGYLRLLQKSASSTALQPTHS